MDAGIEMRDTPRNHVEVHASGKRVDDVMYSRMKF